MIRLSSTISIKSIITLYIYTYYNYIKYIVYSACFWFLFPRNSLKGHDTHHPTHLITTNCTQLISYCLSFFQPSSPHLPSCSSHCQSTPRMTLAPGKMPLAIIFFPLRRHSTAILLRHGTDTKDMPHVSK